MIIDIHPHFRCEPAARVSLASTRCGYASMLPVPELRAYVWR